MLVKTLDDALEMLKRERDVLDRVIGLLEGISPPAASASPANGHQQPQSEFPPFPKAPLVPRRDSREPTSFDPDEG